MDLFIRALEMLDRNGIDAGLIWDAPNVEECDSANALVACMRDGHDAETVLRLMKAQIAGAPVAASDPVALLSGREVVS
jgi:hypothetical protein